MTAQELQDLQAEVALETEIDASAVTLINGFAARLQAALDRATTSEAEGVAKDQILSDLRAGIAAQVTQLKANSGPLAAAVIANTPAAPPAPPAPVPTDPITVTPPSISVEIGHAPIQLVVVTDDGSSVGKAFVSSDPSVATVDTSGVVTPVAPGSCIISVTTPTRSFDVDVVILAA